MQLLDVIAVGVIAATVWEILRARAIRAQRSERREALHSWEAEGGAVPVSPTTIAAQVSPAPDAVPG